MIRVLQFLLLVVLTGCGSRGDNQYRLVSERSGKFIFSSSWESSEPFLSADRLLVYRSSRSGYMSLKQHQARSTLVREIGHKDLRDAAQALRDVISREGASSRDSEPEYQILLVDGAGSILAYWQLNKSPGGGHVAIFPTDGVHAVSGENLLKFINGKAVAP